jgi:hypothetical protein
MINDNMQQQVDPKDILRSKYVYLLIQPESKSIWQILGKKCTEVDIAYASRLATTVLRDTFSYGGDIEFARCLKPPYLGLQVNVANFSWLVFPPSSSNKSEKNLVNEVVATNIDTKNTKDGKDEHMTPLVSATPTAPTSSRSCICTVCQIS